MSPEDRAIRARTAAHGRWSKPDAKLEVAFTTYRRRLNLAKEAAASLGAATRRMVKANEQLNTAMGELQRLLPKD